MKLVTRISLILLLAITTFGFGQPAQAQAEDAMVYVIHGIPGEDLGLDPALPVDVLVNDAICALEGFTFGEIAGPLNLAAGTYNIKISPANAGDPCGNAAVIEADVPFEAGESATVIAHLTEDGAPTASKFTNRVTPLHPLMARLAIRHTAAAPEVDIELKAVIRRLSFSGIIEGISNGEQAGPFSVFTMPQYEVSLYPAGTTDPVFGPVTLNLEAGTAYFVYAIGSLQNETFTLLTHTIQVN